MKYPHALVAMMAAAAPCLASAGDLSHTHVEVGAARLTEDGFGWMLRDTNFDGGYIQGSVALGATGAYGFGGYRAGSGDGPFRGLDQSRMQLGIGYAHGIAPGVEVLGEAGYLRDEIGRYGVNTGRISAGVRGQMGTRTEAWAKAHYTDQTLDSTRYAGELGGLVKLGDTWGVTGGLEIGDLRTEYKLGVRASF
ncbi:hypothetical protein ACFFGH_02285 [Lysobacter korlensis]|uniref:Outer membrane protein beta-barrel domain-containing protein n=1 Tax=Lysobacter korlensis TaxID=553636 RepID=A0ABV6RI74_9GAMM